MKRLLSMQQSLQGYALLWVILLFSAGILAVDLAAPLGIAAGVPYVLVVLLAQWSSDRRHLLATALLASILTVIGYLVSPEGSFQWMVLTNRALALFAIWVTALLCYGRRGVQDRLMEEEGRLALLVETLRESEAILAETQRISRLGSWNWDILEDRLVWSDEVYRIFGRARNSFELTSEAVQSFMHSDDREHVLKVNGAAMETGDTVAMDYRILRPDGEVRHVHAIGRIGTDKEGRAVRMLGTFQDVTEIKHAEEMKLELETRVMRAQKLESLGIMAGGVAHDFNNLLMGILGNADLALAEENRSTKVGSLLEEIIVSSERASDLARQMLAYSGRGKTTLQVLDVNDLVKEMQTLVVSAIAKNVRVEFRLGDDLPSLECDATQIRQVIMNLITNAAEAIGDYAGTIVVATGRETLGPAKLTDGHQWIEISKGEYIYISVKDSGSGIDQDDQEKIFDPFFTTKFTGRGLGLSTVLGIVRGHGGRIELESAPTYGTTFKVSLPVSTKTVSKSVPDVSASSTWRGDGEILLVDDEKVVRDVSARMLKNLGFTVLTATDGDEAIQLYRLHHQDIVCIILDMSMPGLNGEETQRALRKIDPAVPSILASGYDEQDIMGRVTDSHFADVIQKPYQTAVLSAKLQHVLEENALSGG